MIKIDQVKTIMNYMRESKIQELGGIVSIQPGL